ncbi:MAG TPA: hypothetical protein VGI15_02500 [Candidatus Cybelea sp.]
MTPHPLAVRLVEHLRAAPAARVLEFASGRGRNTEALRAAGFTVIAVDDRTAGSAAAFEGLAGPFAAALSTHGLLHGTPATIGVTLAGIAGLLAKNAPLYATFGSVNDARFGSGERIDEFVYAPESGDERGVAHAFFDRERLRALLGSAFEILSLEERDAGQSAGRWAHCERPLSDAVHWFAVATAK